MYWLTLIFDLFGRFERVKDGTGDGDSPGDGPH